MFNFEKILKNNKKNPERFAKAKNPIDDPIKETLDHWNKINITGFPEEENKRNAKDSDIAA